MISCLYFLEYVHHFFWISGVRTPCKCPDQILPNPGVLPRRRMSRFLGMMERAGRYLKLVVVGFVWIFPSNCIDTHASLRLGLVGYVVNIMEPELRTAEESQAMFHEGYEFLKVYKTLTYMSLRRGGLVSDHILPSNMKNQRMSAYDCFHRSVKVLVWPCNARAGIQEWFLKPKCHVPSLAQCCAGVRKLIRLVKEKMQMRWWRPTSHKKRR